MMLSFSSTGKSSHAPAMNVCAYKRVRALIAATICLSASPFFRLALKRPTSAAEAPSGNVTSVSLCAWPGP